MAQGPRSRRGGPTGLGFDAKSQLPSWYRLARWDQSPGAPRLLVAQIFFATASSRVDPDDRAVLAHLARDYRETAAVGRRVRLVFEGHADVRGTEGFNDGLSRARAEAVRNEVTRLLAQVGGLAASVEAFGERFASDSLAESRRVDVYEATSWAEPSADESQYSLKYLKENQQLFRLPIFERWHPQWPLWRPLRHVLKMYEQMEHIHGGDELVIPLQPGDLDQMTALLKRICPDVMRRIESGQAGGASERALRQALFVEYRKAYPTAHEAAEREWQQSGIKNFAEFLADRLGMLKPPAPRS